MTHDDIIIRRLCGRLEEDHGYRFEAPTRSGMTPQAARECLQGLRTPSAVCGFTEFIHRETDFGRVMENEAVMAALIGDIGKLTMAGALPKVIPRQDGLFKQVMDGLFRGSMSPEEARLLGELRSQGEMRAVMAAEGARVETPEAALERVRGEMKGWAAANGAVLTSEMSLDRLRAMPVEELLDALLVTDPHDGLSDRQEIMVKLQKPGMQGFMRDSCERDNRREDYNWLVAAGALPALDHSPAPEGGSFVGRLFRKATRAMTSVPSTESLPWITEAGRSVLRAVLHERAPEILAENRVWDPSA